MPIDQVKAVIDNCHTQLTREGYSFRERTLLGANVLEARIPGFDDWYVLVTEQVPRHRKNVLLQETVDKARTCPSALFPWHNLAVLLPSRWAAGGHQIIPYKVKIGEEERSTLILPIPSIGNLLRPMGPYETTDGEEGAYSFRLSQSGVGQTFLDLANLLSRSILALNAGGGYLSESLTAETVAKVLGTIRPVPAVGKFKDKPGVLVKALTGKTGICRGQRDPRKAGGAHVLWLADRNIPVNDVLLPRVFVDWFNSRARRAGMGQLHKGSQLLVSKFPSCKGVVVRLVGYSRKALILSDEIIEYLAGDCDGDSPSIIHVPDGICCTGMWAKQLLPGRKTPAKGWPQEWLEGEYKAPDFGDDDGAEALKELTLSKLGMGPVTIKFRVLPAAYPDLRVMELPMGAASFPTGMGFWLCEAVISKKSNLSLKDAARLLDRVVYEPQAVADELIALHELFALNETETRQTCQYLADRQIHLVERLKGAPTERVLTEAPIYWTLENALSTFDQRGLNLLND
jgi:hypothetical protein